MRSGCSLRSDSPLLRCPALRSRLPLRRLLALLHSASLRCLGGPRRFFSLWPLLGLRCLLGLWYLLGLWRRNGASPRPELGQATGHLGRRSLWPVLDDRLLFRSTHARNDQPCTQQLQLQPRRSCARHLAECLIRQIRALRGAFGTQRARLVNHGRILVFRNGNEDILRFFSCQGNDDQVTQPLEKVLHETARIMT